MPRGITDALERFGVPVSELREIVVMWLFEPTAPVKASLASFPWMPRGAGTVEVTEHPLVRLVVGRVTEEKRVFFSKDTPMDEEEVPSAPQEGLLDCMYV